MELFEQAILFGFETRFRPKIKGIFKRKLLGAEADSPQTVLRKRELKRFFVLIVNSLENDVIPTPYQGFY